MEKLNTKINKKEFSSKLFFQQIYKNKRKIWANSCLLIAGTMKKLNTKIYKKEFSLKLFFPINLENLKGTYEQTHAY